MIYFDFFSYESERKDAKIKSLQDTMFLRNAQLATKDSTNEGE